MSQQYPAEQRRQFAKRLEAANVPPRRFIDVRDGEKGTRTEGHQQVINWLDADDSDLRGNYGVHPGHGLIEFDVDDYDDEHDTEKLDALPETFTVESPHTDDNAPGHRYYAVEDDDETKAVLKEITGTLNPKPTWGEIKYKGQYVVGPGSQLDGCSKDWCDECAKPDGGYYRIAENRPIATLSADDLAEVLRADPEFSADDTGQPAATDVFDLDPEEEDTTPNDGDEWMTPELAEKGLKEIDPDVKHAKWFGVGVALVNHFGSTTGGSLFKQWSRQGQKWDKKHAESVIDDAGDYPHDIRHFVNVAKDYGWDASAAAREATAATDGGVTAKSSDQGSSPDTGTTPDSSEARGWIDAQEYFRSGKNGTSGEACQIAARQLLDDYDLLTVEETDHIWRYDPETGIYEGDAEARLRKRLADGLGPTYSRSRVNDILHRVRSETYEKRDALTAPKNMVCVANGVLDLSDPRSLELLDHSPERRFTWRLNADYDPDAEATEFKEFLGDVVRADDLPKLQQFAGSTLRHWKQPRNLLAILGPTDAGKGVFLRVLKGVFGGSDNVASESLYSLAETRWGAAQLHRTPINITNELSTGTLKNPDQVKKLAGEGDQISAENKGEDPFQFVPKTSHLFATNQVPKVENGDDAFYNRWLFVTFPTTVPPNERDETLTDRIVQDAEERSGVLNWLLAGYAEYREQTGYNGERSIGEKEDMWSAYGDSVDRFIDKCIDSDSPDEKIPKTDAYEAYKEMCDEVGLPAEAKQTLTRRLKKISGVSDVRPSKNQVDAITSDADRPSCYRGVTWTEDGEKFLDFVRREHLRNDDSEDEERDGFNGSLGGY